MHKPEDYKRHYKDKRTGISITYYSKYRLDYKEHIILKQIAFNNMQDYNKSVKYNKALTHTVNQELAILYKKPKEELLELINSYLEAQEKQNTEKLVQHKQSQIIVKKLQNLTDKQVEQLATRLQQLEELYYLQLDTDYTDKQSIIINYQQYMAYKKAGIQLEPRHPETLIGNLELIERIQ
jgi:hypothetical protein